MSHDAVNTVQLNGWVDRMRAGDRAAADELLQSVCARLERLARKMLGQFPGVQRWTDTDDVLQNSLMRLLRALQEVRPANTREFFGLAAVQMRRELLDLARHYRGSRAIGGYDSGIGGVHESAPKYDPAERPDPAHELDRWEAFHARVESLPPEEREVMGLVFYHGWTQGQVAELFQVSERTIRRWWESALVTLRAVVKD